MQHDAGEARLLSRLCTQEQLASPTFEAWAERLAEPHAMHRKTWEWCYIAEALEAYGMLAPGKRGLGFAVGKEPLPSVFAALGCQILATDQPSDGASADGWAATDQHARSLEQINERGLCPPELLRERVSFSPCDMNDIPSALGGFDFLWSACSLEHLGSIGLGEQFIYRSLACLKPGGIAVHTTEYNVSSNSDTIDYRSTVIFRRQDIERIVAKLSACGHEVAPLDLSEGNMPNDAIVDLPPYSQDIHLKLRIKDYVCTSVGIIIKKTSDELPQASLRATPRRLRDVVRQLGRNVERALKRRREARRAR
jgi:hypothetical protein